MLSIIQKYSYSTITIDDFSIDEIEKRNTYEIYKVKVNKSNYQIDGDFYVALSKPNGISTSRVYLNKDLTKLRDTLNTY